ncbi:MAG: c-type cytochrome [Xanthobacteraceae bacterium]|jgi:mono/diheme cytochrome c family protein
MLRFAMILGALATTMTTASAQAPVAPDAASAQSPLARGTYLMNSIVACGNCHTPQTPQGPVAGKELAGGTPFREGFGVAYAPNITTDPETGIGKWTDQQIITAIREGKRPDGTVIGPPMPIPLYRDMSDEDVQAIVAYIRAVPPVANKVAKSEYKIPLPPAYGPPITAAVTAPPKSDKVAYGAYLAGPLGHCIECHSSPGANGAPDFVNHLGAGGMNFNGPWGTTVARNITPTNLGTWLDSDIKTAITTGVRPGGERLRPPMAYGYYKNINGDDLDAIVAYLRSLKAK